MITNDGVNLYIGVVVDIDDPLKANRVKVRILGLYGDDVDNKHLPWAIVNMPVTSASTNGIGQNHGLVNSSLVTVYFIDGVEQQIPLVMGSISGIQKEYFKNASFKDPNGKFPIVDRLGEPDVNRLARNDKTNETIMKDKESIRDTSINIAFGGSWDEPESAYNAKYPYNKVIETVSGHVIEIDDTPDAERIHIYHKSGAFIEMFPNGDVVAKNNNGYDISKGKRNMYIKGDYNITVERDCNMKIDGKLNIEVSGDIKMESSNNIDIKAGNIMNLNASRINLN